MKEREKKHCKIIPSSFLDISPPPPPPPPRVLEESDMVTVPETTLEEIRKQHDIQIEEVMVTKF